LAIIRASYPRFYQTAQTNEDVETTVNLWAEMFENDDVMAVKLAVKSLINTLEFPPTIADIKKEMNKLFEVINDENGAIDEWNQIKTALRNSAYYSVEMFERLPPIAKRFVGSPSQLRCWGLDPDFNDGVIRGQFLKQYEVLKDRERHAAMLPENVKSKLKELAEQKGLKVLEGEKV